MEDGQSVEGATISLEGLAGIAVFLGEDRTDDEVICQVAGPGARMAASANRRNGHANQCAPGSPFFWRVERAVQQLVQQRGCGGYPTEKVRHLEIRESEIHDERTSQRA
jgi:hypothetical protein